ncbi:hypothetical protein Tcan_13914 [Toxocara canis]|uniref:Uncharacterized protein n=2 Tax=Toxocara canis TaxID=6265 RepID=A0A0B2W2J7_TOXCA|nr:hypothetical protein Tcan_13914 [Toxocara canis]VDM48098.1 unnamed protein product [Toxocara canis]
MCPFHEKPLSFVKPANLLFIQESPSGPKIRLSMACLRFIAATAADRRRLILWTNIFDAFSGRTIALRSFSVADEECGCGVATLLRERDVPMQRFAVNSCRRLEGCMPPTNRLSPSHLHVGRSQSTCIKLLDEGKREPNDDTEFASVEIRFEPNTA